MRKTKLIVLALGVKFAFIGALLAGPVNPPAGNAIQNQSLPQTAVFNVSSATIRGQLSVGSVKFPNGTIQISSAPSVAFPSLSPGVMQVVGVSSTVVTAAVSLSSSVIGNLGVSHFNSGTNASTNTWWNGGGTWMLIPNSNPPFACSVGGTQISSPTFTVNFDSATFAGSQSPTGTANITMVPSSVTLQGNGFNGANQLLKLNGSGLVPNAEIDSSSVTKLGPTITLGQQTQGIFVASVTTTAPLTGGGQGVAKIITLGVDASSVTLAGNTFNGNSQLVKTDSSGRLPAIDGSQLTNLPPTQITTGSTNYIQNTVTPQANSNFSVTAGNVQGLLTVGAVTSSGAVSGTSLSLQTQTPTDTLTENMASSVNAYQTIVYRSSGTVLTPLNITNGYELGSNFWRAYVANNWHNAGGIRAFVDTGSLASGAPSEILFYTDDGTDSDKARFEIRGNGQARFGTNLNGSETQTSLVHVDGSLGITNGVDTSTMTFRSAGPGILHVVAVSSAVASGLVDLTSEVSNVLPVAHGGTGQSTYTDGTLLIGNSATGGLVATQLLPGPEIQVVNGNGTITIGVSGMVTTSSSTVNFLQGIKTTTETITSASPGVMHVDGSSNVVTGLVSLSTETTGAFISSVNVSGAFIVTPNGASNNAITLSANASSTTLQGNAFNSGSELVQLSGGLIPNANIDGSSVTKQGNTFNGASQLLQLSSSDLIPNALVDASSVTKQGNTFNGASQLVQMNGSTQLPAVSGVNLTNLNASNLASGTVPDARLDASSVTLQSNTFNAANKLVQLNGSTQYPALDGSLITNLTLTGTPIFSTVTVRNAISASTATLAISTITVTQGSQVFVSTSSGGNPPAYSFSGFSTSGLGANSSGVPILLENGNTVLGLSNSQTTFTNGSNTLTLSSTSGFKYNNAPIADVTAGSTPAEFDWTNQTHTFQVQALPANNRTYTIPDAGQNSAFALTAATQTFTGPNTFTSTTSFTQTVTVSSNIVVSNSGAVTVPAGAVSATSLNFGTNGTGIYSTAGASHVDVASGGSLVLDINGSEFNPKVQIGAATGAANAPSISFDADLTKGFYSAGSDIGVSIAGSQIAQWEGSGYQAADGTASNPSLTYFNQVHTGLYRNGNGINMTGNSVPSLGFGNGSTNADDGTNTELKLYGGAQATTNNSTSNFDTFTTSVTTSSKTILQINTSGTGSAGMALVYGADGAGNEFCDMIMFRADNNANPSVVTSFASKGTPASRTYAAGSNGQTNLQMGSGTYGVRVLAFEVGRR